MIFLGQFTVVEQVNLSVTSTHAEAAFTSVEGIDALDIMVINKGSKGCQLKVGVAGVTAVASASADHTRQYYITPSTGIVIGKGSGVSTISAITDGSDTTSLVLLAGRGN